MRKRNLIDPGQIQITLAELVPFTQRHSIVAPCVHHECFTSVLVGHVLHGAVEGVCEALNGSIESYGVKDHVIILGS